MKTTTAGSSIRSKLAAGLLLILALVSSYQWWTTSAELVATQAACNDLPGTVTLDAQPLASGVFELKRADGQTLSAPITQGKFRLASVPAGEWQQSIRGPGVPELYRDSGPVTLDASIGSLQFGLKGSEQLKLYAEHLTERAEGQ